MVLLIGSNGYVGSAFARRLASRGLPFTCANRAELGACPDRQRLLDLLRTTRPEFIVCAAGYTGKPNVDACERHRTDCIAGNVVLPGLLAEVCAELDLPWGLVSSGCIYNGPGPEGRSDGFAETDPPNFSFRSPPCSFYSGSKALGEEVVLSASGGRCYIWRLRIPFDSTDNSRNYLSKLMRYERLLQAENSLSHLGDFVESALACHERSLPFGIYNLTNPGSVTTRQVTEMIRAAGLTQKDFRFFESEAEFMETAAITPRSNCVLNTAKAEAAGLPMRPVAEALEHALSNWRREDGV